MPLITDPDSLTNGLEITINTGTKKITINANAAGGNLTNEGITGQALYSFLKEEWKNVDTLIPFDFPLVSITPEQFEWVEGWQPFNDTTRYLLRTCGWRELTTAGATTREYMGIITLGNIDAGDRAYYSIAGQPAELFNFEGAVNQGVQTFGDVSNGNFDYRTQGITTFIRTRAKLYGSATSESIGLNSLNYIANRFPLSESIDTKITALDTAIEADDPYDGMSITYGTVTRTIGDFERSFKVVIDGNNGTLEQINEFVQYSLRQQGDIDRLESGRSGVLADQLTVFIGNDLKTLGGTFIDRFQANDTNRLVFTDAGDVERAFPFVAAGNLSFNANLVGDATSIYRVFFQEGFGTANAILVKNSDGDDISGLVGGRSSIGFSYDFDENIQRGAETNATPAPVVVVAIGLAGAQYVTATSTITRATGQNISLVAPLERNYST